MSRTERESKGGEEGGEHKREREEERELPHVPEASNGKISS